MNELVVLVQVQVPQSITLTLAWSRLRVVEHYVLESHALKAASNADHPHLYK
jgi:hypothetical protein